MTKLLWRIWAWLLYVLCGKVLPVTKLVVTYLNSTNDNMENYRVRWQLSPSTFLDRLETYLGVDGATPAKLGDLSPSTDNVVVAVPTGERAYSTCVPLETMASGLTASRLLGQQSTKKYLNQSQV